MGSHLFESCERRQLFAAAVVGNVFRDANRDGVRQSTEGPQANVRVFLDYNNDGVRNGDAEPLAITNSNGRYEFGAANAPATINVRLLLTGTNFLQSRPAANAPRVVTTTEGGRVEAESFGVYERTPEPTPARAIVTGIVYTDLDRDGTRDAGENGRANVAVYVDANRDGVRQSSESTVFTNAGAATLSTTRRRASNSCASGSTARTSSRRSRPRTAAGSSWR